MATNFQTGERGAVHPTPSLWTKPARSIFGRKPIRFRTKLFEGVRDSPT